MMKEKKNNKRSNLTRILAVAMMLVTVLTSIPVSASAASKDTLSFSITNGMAVLSVNGSETYQLTKALVTSSGGIDNNGTVYLVWKSGSVYWYNYEYQKNDTELHLLDTKVLSLKKDSSGNVTGYETTDGEKSVLTLEQVKSALGVSNNSSNNNSSSSTNSSNNSSSSTNSSSNSSNSTNSTNSSSSDIEIMDSTIVFTDKNSKYYVSNWSASVEEAYKLQDGNIAVALSNGILYKWDYVNNKQEVIVAKYTSLYVVKNILVGYWNQNDKLILIESQTTQNQTTQTGTTLKSVDFDESTGTVTLVLSDNTKKHLIKNSTIESVGYDNQVVYLRCNTNKLYVYSYNLQKDAEKVTFVKVSTKCSALVVVDGKALGYYEEGNSKMKALLTETEIKTALANAEATSETKEVVYAHHTSPKGYYKILKNSNNKKVDSLKLKNKKLVYHGVTTKNVKWAVFNDNGNVVYCTTKGACVVINHETLKKTTIKKSGVSSYNENDNGIGKYAVKKDGTRFSIKKY